MTYTAGTGSCVREASATLSCLPALAAPRSGSMLNDVVDAAGNSWLELLAAVRTKVRIAVMTL